MSLDEEFVARKAFYKNMSSDDIVLEVIRLETENKMFKLKCDEAEKCLSLQLADLQLKSDHTIVNPSDLDYKEMVENK